MSRAKIITWRWQLTGLLVLSAIATGGAYLLTTVSRGRVESLDQRFSRFDHVLMALQLYDDNNGHLPSAVKHDSAGNMLYSWRVSLLPFVQGLKNLLNLNAPWNDPSNQYFLENEHRLFCNQYETERAKRIKGVVSVLVGSGTPIQLESSMGLSQVPKDTILVIEAIPHTMHWMAPGDTTIGTDDLMHCNAEGLIVGFADGEIWHLRDSVPVEELMKFATAVSGSDRSRDAVLGPFKTKSMRARGFDKH